MSSLILVLFFCFCLLSTLLASLIPSLPPLHCFYPYLLLILYQRPFKHALLQAFLCGLLIDLLSSSLPLGFFTSIFMIALYGFYRFKHFFFIDKIMTFPILTFLFSSFVTLIHRLTLNIFCLKSPLTLKWMATDLIIMPLGDALFALVFFAFSLKFLSKWLNLNTRRHHSLSFKEKEL